MYYHFQGNLPRVEFQIHVLVQFEHVFRILKLTIIRFLYICPSSLVKSYDYMGETRQKGDSGQKWFDRNEIESGLVCTVKNIHPAYQFTTPIITFRCKNYEFNLLFACSISLNLSFRSWFVTKSVIRVTNKTRKRSRWNIFVFFRKLPQDISYFHGCTTHARISIAAPLNIIHYAPLLFTSLFKTPFLTFDLRIDFLPDCKYR